MRFIKKNFYSLFLLLFCTAETSEPLKEIPEALYDAYTRQAAIPVLYWYLNNAYPSNQPRLYNKKVINSLIKQAKARVTRYYHLTDTYLYRAFEKHLSYIEGKNVAVLGSVQPWYESIVLAFDGRPTTIEYNKIISHDPRLEVMTVTEYDEHPKKFDALVSISSFEHDGLGRYGDPINPDGDLKAMERAKNMLNENGVLFLAVPVGKDCLLWNACRIYGEIRLPLLLQGWDIVDSFGFNPIQFDNSILGNWKHQPVFVLKPKR